MVAEKRQFGALMDIPADQKTIYFTFVALLAATVAASFVPLGTSNTMVAMLIAICRTMLVGVVFMNLRGSSGSTRLAAAAGLLWLSFAMVCVLADYDSRGWDEAQSHALIDVSVPTRLRSPKRKQDYAVLATDDRARPWAKDRGNALAQGIVQNLISNALKYSEARTPVVVTARQSSGKIIVQVIYCGAGIERDDAAETAAIYRWPLYPFLNTRSMLTAMI